ncbi:hypothetical protein ACOBV9_21480 (plasmid) [Pseudoalteromonas espejiana]
MWFRFSTRAEDGTLTVTHSVVACEAANNFGTQAIGTGNVESGS